MFIEGTIIVEEAANRLVEEGKREGVARGKEHHINVFFGCPIFKNSRAFSELSHFWLQHNSPREEAKWQLFIDNYLKVGACRWKRGQQC